MKINSYRNAFKMQLKPGFEVEYKRRHIKIWPELKALLSESEIQDYSIYLDEETMILFAIQKINRDFDVELLADHPLMKKWWAYMADIMETNPDNSPVVTSLIEVFHMD